MFKKCFFITLLLVSASMLFAGGRRENNESREASDPSAFTDSIDTSEKKPGKWNYYLEARDNAGNIALSGPENIFLDPESDLPRVTIINPMPAMRVQGNLNIVGIAFDDDSVSHVMLTVTRGMDGSGEELLRVRTQGSDHWSYFLDTTNSLIWTDGVYTITAWAVDNKGLSGDLSNAENYGYSFKPKQSKAVSVNWNLDRKKPDTVVTSHEAGSVVSGRLRLKGQVIDGNGIRSLAYSTDGGVRYASVKGSADRRSGEYTWEIDIDTKKIFEDGPVVIWFRAQDMTGSVGYAAHLLFINNTGPEVEIVYPSPETVVNGIFTIAGYSSHPVGIQSISWNIGKGTGGEFELLPGNPFWSADIDIRGVKTNTLDVEVRAVDISGNVTVAKQRYRVDQNADLPVVTLAEPNPLSPVVLDGNTLVVKGKAEDDDGIASVFYSVGAEIREVEIPTSGYFQFEIKDIPEGTHLFEIWAKDITGVTGNKVQIKSLTVPPPPPKPAISTVTSGSIVQNFYTGMTIELVPKIRVNMEVTVEAQVINAASIQFGELPPAAIRPSGRDGVLRATVQVPANLPSGYTKIELRVTDRAGNETVYPEYVFVNQTDPLITERTGPQGRWFEWIRPNELSGRIFFGSRDERLLGLASDPFTANSRITLTGDGSENLRAMTDEYGRVVLSALNEGVFGPVTFTMGGITSRPFNVIADFSGPSVRITKSPTGWIQSTVDFTVNLVSSFNTRSLEYSLNMGESWQILRENVNEEIIVSDEEDDENPLPINKTTEHTITIPSSIEDGSIMILVRAVNENGRIGIAGFTVLKDTQPPKAELVMPNDGARVNGTIRMGFGIEERGALKSVTYFRPAVMIINEDEEEEETPEIRIEVFNAERNDKEFQPQFIEVLMDSLLMPLDPNMRFIFEDRAGNTSEVGAGPHAGWPFVIDQEMDIPVVQVILPEEGEVITTDFIISGIMFDDDGIKQIYWNIDEGDDHILVPEIAENSFGGGFYIPIPLSTLTDNEHIVTVWAEDIYGVKGESVSRMFKVSLSEPSAEMTFPQFDIVLNETIELKGNAFDENGIQKVQISVDNGNTFNDAYIVSSYIAGNVTEDESTDEESDEPVDESPVEETADVLYNTIDWVYEFNSKILKDGAHVVFIRVFDKYEIPATYANMINIDNTPPDVVIDSPFDGSMSIGSADVMGRVIDPNIEDVRIELRSLDGEEINDDIKTRVINTSSIIKETLNLTGLSDGLYNIEVVAIDRAGNITRVSRNIELARESYKNFVEIMYPLDNENVQGEFNLYGLTGGTEIASHVTISINGRDVITNEVDPSGYFRFPLNGGHLRAGVNTIVVHSNFGGRERIESKQQNIVYKPDGPWITIDSFTFGDFAYERPYLTGRFGYELSAQDRQLLEDKSTEKEIRNEITGKAPSFAEISFDNGKTFIKMSNALAKDIDYRYRLETGEMTEGMHYIYVRATMKNGETAFTRMLVQVDKTPPVIRLISPEAGGVYNTEVPYSASAADDVELSSLTYHLRKGDKNSYQVPGFLQGLYIEGIIPPFLRQATQEIPAVPFGGGVTYTDIGMGLSFFDDNVKIQLQYGMMSQKLYESLGGEGIMRYGGNVFAIKLLANIYTLPFGSFAGPDWEWLSASLGVGANFSLFSESQSGSPTWMSALLLQLEFPKVTIKKAKYFRTYSLFTEGQLWFVPTDVDAKRNEIDVVFPKVIMGIRVYVF